MPCPSRHCSAKPGSGRRAAEGSLSREASRALRKRLPKYCSSAAVIQGPGAGDEYAQSRGGNNNYYGHDTKMTRFDWDALERRRPDFFRFYRYRSSLHGL